MASPVSLHVLEGFDAESRRRLRQMWLLSAVGHLALLSLFWLVPESEPVRRPRAISVSLLAAPPAPAPAPAPVTKPAPTPVTKPAPAPAPRPSPPPPPPAPKVKVLPKQAPPAAAKPREVSRPEPVVRRRPRPEELSYDEALAKLRGDLGEAAPMADPTAKPKQATASTTADAPSAGTQRISPELAAWQLAVKRHVRAVWITPPEFRERGLAAEVAVDVAANGSLMGRPKLLRSSGNPFYDDNAIRALVKSSPLPPPPAPGRRVLVFAPEE